MMKRKTDEDAMDFRPSCFCVVFVFLHVVQRVKSIPHATSTTNSSLVTN